METTPTEQIKAAFATTRKGIKEKLVVAPINQEINPLASVPLEYWQHRSLANAIYDAYKERHEEATEEGQLPEEVSPEEAEKVYQKYKFEGSGPNDSITTFPPDMLSLPLLDEEKYAEIAQRAANVYANIKHIDSKHITFGRIEFLEILKEAYTRVTDPQIKADAKRLAVLLGFSSDLNADQNQDCVNVLVNYNNRATDSPTGESNDASTYKLVFTKLLGDEQKARDNAAPIMDHAYQYMSQVKDYLEKNNIDLHLPNLEEDMIFASRMNTLNLVVPHEEPSIQPSMGILGISGATIANPEFMLDNRPIFLRQIDDNFDATDLESVAVEALSIVKTAVHETLHTDAVRRHKVLNAPVNTQWGPQLREALTDLGALQILKEVGIWSADQDGIPSQKNTGYIKYNRVVIPYIRTNLISWEEVLQFSFAQDPDGFKELIDMQFANATKETKDAVVAELTRYPIIKEDRINYFLEQETFSIAEVYEQFDSAY